MKKDWVGPVITYVLVIGAICLWIYSGNKKSNTSQDLTPQPTSTSTYSSPVTSNNNQPSGSADVQVQASSPKTTCIDVTSYDYNWDNDMLCTRPDGTRFYTSYSGAAQYR
jgi:hypothetical protein